MVAITSSRIPKAEGHAMTLSPEHKALVARLRDVAETMAIVRLGRRSVLHEAADAIEALADKLAEKDDVIKTLMLAVEDAEAKIAALEAKTWRRLSRRPHTRKGR